MDEVTYIIVALALTSSRSASVFNLNSSSLNDNSSNWWIEFPSLMTFLKNVVFKSSLYPHNWSYYLFDWVCSDQYAGIEGLQFLLLYTQFNLEWLVELCFKGEYKHWSILGVKHQNFSHHPATLIYLKNCWLSVGRGCEKRKKKTNQVPMKEEILLLKYSL